VTMSHQVRVTPLRLSREGESDRSSGAITMYDESTKKSQMKSSERAQNARGEETKKNLIFSVPLINT